MTVVICSECGERSVLRSQFEVEGSCPECGADDALVVADEYADAPETLRCVRCRREVDAAPPGSALSAESGRYTVDDDCPLCEEGELVPADQVLSPRAKAEVGLARKAAQKLTGDQPQLPVDVERLAGLAGLEVIRGPFDHDGMLVGERIEVPNSTPATERFVIAHELGHFTLRHLVPEDKIEQEANAFASEMLMPPAVLKATVAEGLTLHGLCGRFVVNRQPMIYALGTHGLIDQVALSG